VESLLALKTLYILVYRKHPPLTFGTPIKTTQDKEVSGGESKSMKLNENQNGKNGINDPNGRSKRHQSCDPGTADGTGAMPIKLMRSEYSFGHGDSGGIIIKSCDLHSSESFDDVLGRLTGDVMMNHEVQALCLVELLLSLKHDGLSGEFFLHLMKELTNIVSNEQGTNGRCIACWFVHLY
jgi:hypothetical protein